MSRNPNLISLTPSNNGEFVAPPLNLSLPPITLLPDLPDQQIPDFNEEDEYTECHIDEESSFFSTFIDGSSLRNLIEYLRLINIDAVFRYKKD